MFVEVKYPFRFYFFIFWRNSPTWAQAASLLKFRDHTHGTRHSQKNSGRVIGLTQRPLSDNTQRLQEAGFEPSTPANDWPQTQALERAGSKESSLSLTQIEP